MPIVYKITGWLQTAGRLPALLGMLGVTILAAVSLQQLAVEPDTRSMISQQPAELERYDHFRGLFGNDESLLLSVTPAELLSEEGLAVVAELTLRVSAIDGVRQVLSLSNARQLVHGRYGAEEQPLMPSGPAETIDMAAVRSALAWNPHFENLLISGDRQTAGIVIELDDLQDDTSQRRRVIGAIRQLMNDPSMLAELHLAGVGVQKIDVSDYIQRDQKIVLPLVAIILAGMLAIIFRCLSGVLLPLLVTGVSLVWTMGLYALSGHQLNTITSLLPPVVMVLAIANSIHLYNGWLHLVQNGRSQVERLSGKVAELFTPCLFTALTTACGLLSLSISAIPAVRQFALFAAIGVMLSLVVSMVLMPIGLSFLSPPRRRDRHGTGRLRRILRQTAELTVSYPWPIMLTAVLLLAVTLLGLPRLDNNTNLVGFLHDDSPLAVDTAYIDRHLSGVNALEFMLTRDRGQVLDQPEDYARMAAFEAAARREAGVANSFSILTLLSQLHRAETGQRELSLPADGDTLRYELELLTLATDEALQRRFLSADLHAARISIWLHDVGSQTAADVVKRLVGHGKTYFGDGYQLVPTGSFYQMVEDSNRLVADMLKSFCLSLVLILLSILLLVRSLWLTLLAMIPNLLPILWTFGLMGYFRIDLSTGTAMIGAVVIGLAVDDTIHYLVHYQRVYSGNTRRAVIATTTRIGRALLIASLVLAFGFWAGCFGSFKPTVYFSFLVGGTLLGALVCDLVVLPACLVIGSRVKGATT